MSQEEKNKIYLPAKGTSSLFRDIALLGLSALFLWKVLPGMIGIMIMFTIALLLAYLFEPFVYNLENRGLHRLYSIIVLYLGVGLLVYLIGYFLYGPIKNEIRDLVNVISNDNIVAFTSQIKDWLGDHFPFIQEEQIDALLRDIQNRFLRFAQSTLSFVQSIFGLVTQIIIVPLIAFFILKDGPRIKREFIRLVPNKYFEAVLHLAYKTDRQIGRYIRSQLLDSLILAILYSIGFSILGIPYFIVLGAFSGIANIIPYFGPVFAAIPPIIVIMIDTGSMSMVPATVLLFVIIQVVEVAFIQPAVVAKSIDIHPLILIFAVLAGGEVLGVIGMLFAVLLAGVTKVIIVEVFWIYRNYMLGKKQP